MSKQPVFITGNAHKAEHIANLLGLPIQHEALELDEIQAKSPEDVIRHKVMEAYEILQKPLFVDDYSLWLDELDGLPGPFIKFFVNAEDGLEKLCRMADGLKSRRVTARAYFGYFDGEELKIIHGEVRGDLATHPKGNAEYAFGSDPIFCVDGYGGRSRAELTRQEYDDVYAKVRAIDEVRNFLKTKI
ncbi:TPA: non-canonical purine NTP pyrophosphatase [Candidatus Saccharibacteria bacterium]|nr:non-canonical purine NTP pyrophosphatase [Candidatus Saccharibacteria bacterium]